MAKIMLVEDDNNLREIYQARLAAEGYEIVSAKDGEEALALAVKEKPDLIVCDVMMPKVSGFEMLDILRSTAGIKDTKVIMMTALSQAEDKVRAEKLGADRYLVKSQVTLEDMAKSVRDVLSSSSADSQQTSPEQILTNAADKLNSASVPAPTRPDDKSMEPIKIPVVAVPAPTAKTDDSDDTSDGVAIARKKVIQPLNDLSKPDSSLDELLAKEEAKEKLEMGQSPQPVIADTSMPTSDNDGPAEDEIAEAEPPGKIVAPQNDSTEKADPNSIAL